MKVTESQPAFIIGLFLLASACFGIGYLTKSVQINEAKLNTCTESHLCPRAVEAIEHLRDYQLEVYEDSTVIFDGDRHVSTLRYDSTQALDSVIMDDNQ